MAASFFFYDLETSGFDPARARIMQFAGQRTDSYLQPIGEPVNIMIKLPPDVLPSPDAIMVTGITPQATIQDGVTEAEFLQYFYNEVVKPDTTFLGFNTVRFDDEFMRYLHYRNFYDPYEWQWCEGCSRWDILDLVRMTRALRPDDINWPVTEDGKPTNRLELLTQANGLDHQQAHDALSDVMATIAVAKLIQQKQPDLFKYAFDCRAKKRVAEVVSRAQPFVYTTGRYASDVLHTSVAVLLVEHPQPGCALVYNLRYDPTPFLNMSVDELTDAWRFKKAEEQASLRLPIKTLKYNRCPAIAPLGVIKDKATQTRIKLTLPKVEEHLRILRGQQQQFSQRVLEALGRLDQERENAQAKQNSNNDEVDTQLYAGFLKDKDKQTMRAVRAADPDNLMDFEAKFSDPRLKRLLVLYKARNYPANLTPEERKVWEEHIVRQLFSDQANSRMAQYFARLQELAGQPLSSQQEYILEELQLYGESIMPSDISEQ